MTLPDPSAISDSGIAVLALLGLFCGLAACLDAIVHALLWWTRRIRKPEVLPAPWTLEYRNVTSILRWKALRGSGADRFKLAEFK